MPGPRRKRGGIRLVAVLCRRTPSPTRRRRGWWTVRGEEEEDKDSEVELGDPSGHKEQPLSQHPYPSLAAISCSSTSLKKVSLSTRLGLSFTHMPSSITTSRGTRSSNGRWRTMRKTRHRIMCLATISSFDSRCRRQSKCGMLLTLSSLEKFRFLTL